MSKLPLQRAVAENRRFRRWSWKSPASGRRWFGGGFRAPIRDQNGSVAGGVAVTLDITERKRAELQLKEVADKYSTRSTTPLTGVHPQP